MKDLFKLVLFTGIGVCVALVVTLPIVLTNEKVETAPDDPGAQRFPNHNFVKLSNLYDGTLKTKSFKNEFSKKDPNYYICTNEDGEYFKREWNVLLDQADSTGRVDYEDCSDSTGTKITSDNFKTFRNEEKMIDCTLSSDELYLFCYKECILTT